MAIIGKNIERAAELLLAGEVIGIPTETVYGLAANGSNPTAVKKIFKVKNRPSSNPLILHISAIDHLAKYGQQIPQMAYDLAEKFWPGALTLLLPKNSDIISEVTAGLPRVALRMPDHPLTLSLLTLLDFPVAAPSANPYGYISPTLASHVNDQLGDKIPYILDGGPSKKGIESTIVGFENNIPVIYRQGVITAEDIKSVTGNVQVFNSKTDKPLTSGMSLSHYAPKTPVYLTSDILRCPLPEAVKNVGVLSFEKHYSQFAIDRQITLSMTGSLEEAASNLYEALHRLDAMGLDAIIAEYAPNTGIGAAINDRLTRAAKKRNE